MPVVPAVSQSKLPHAQADGLAAEPSVVAQVGILCSLPIHPFHLANTYNSIVGDTCDVSVPRDSFVKITRKTSANFAPLNSSIARGALRSRRCLRRRPPQAPAESQVSKRNTRIKRRKFRRGFWGYFDRPRT